MSEMFRREYRVETRRTADHPGGESGWFPEGGDHYTLLERGQAEAYRDGRARWYANARFWEHRIVARAVSDWSPVIPTVEFPS